MTAATVQETPGSPLKSGSTKMIAAIAVVVFLGLVAVGAYLRSTSGLPDFLQNQTVSAMGEMRLDFPEVMNHDSVMEHLALPDGLSADSKWDGETLVFKPKEKWVANETYVFTLDKKALTAAGQPLGKDMEFIYKITGAPTLAAQVPAANSLGVDSQTRIALVFDRPMVALSQVQGKAYDQKMAAWPVKVTPDVPGRWRWLGTTTAEFTPDKPFPLATQFTVTVPVGIQTANGEKTEKDFSCMFETVRPEFTGSEPGGGTDTSGPKTQIVLHFNQNIDLESVKQHVSVMRDFSSAERRGEARKTQDASATSGLTVAPGETLAMKSVVYGTTVGADKKKVIDKTTVVLIPAEPLVLHSSYSVTLEAGIVGIEGNLGTNDQRSFTFSTVGPLRVVSHDTQDNNRIHIAFSNPMLGATIKKNLVIKPELEGWKDMELGTNDWDGNKDVYIYGPFKPSTTYKVTVLASMTDREGQKLEGGPVEFSFTTPQIAPEVFIHSNGQFGIFEKGKPPIYYLNGVNVSKFTLELGHLTLENFLKIRSEQRGNSFQPEIKDLSTDYRTWDVNPKLKHDEWKSVPLDVAKEGGQTLGAGVYAFTMRSPEYRATWSDNKEIVQYQYFTLTNMSITMKYSGDKALVWVTNMQTGDPVRGAAIKFFTLNGTATIKGTTDNLGFFETAVDLQTFVTGNNDYKPEFWVTAEKDGDMAFIGSDWSAGISPYDFNGIYEDFHYTGRSKYRVQSYLYTERGAYRPGDKVSFKGIVRYLDWNGKLSVPGGAHTAQVTISDAEGKEVYNKELKLNGYGTFNGVFELGKEVSLGSYYMYAKMLPDADAKEQYISTSFNVLAYRKPEYSVEVKPESDDYFNGEVVKATVEGLYYFGAPMNGAKVHWTAYSTDYFFNKYTDGWYSFALQDDWCWWECDRGMTSVTEGDGVLDETGHMQLYFPADINDKGVSQVYTIEANITDTNNQEVSNRSSVIVHKADMYVGIRTDDYVVTPGQKAKMAIVTLTPEGVAAPNVPVSLGLYSRTWDTTEEKGVDGQYYYDNKPVDTFISTITGTTDDKGKAVIEVPVDTGGEFRIVASVKDASGREAKAGAGVYAWSSTYFNWPQSTNAKVDVVADKPEYKVGDTAKLLVKSPYQGKGVKALVTVERENVITKTLVDVTSNALPIEIPITEDLIPNAYVSVVIVKPRVGETFNENGLDTGVPAFKIGYVKLQVETSSKQLKVNVETDKKKYGPGEEVTVTVKTADWTGKAVPAEVSLGTVDMSVIALTGFQLPDPVAIFYANRGLGVSTSQMLIHLLERFKPGSKGGGGGDPEERIRSNFKDTAYWNPVVMTDANGNAKVTFKLPDNLTTWQVLAIANTKDSLFGAFAHTFVETKRVIVRPVQPRFAVMGDQLKLSAIVHNFMDEPKTFTVTLKATNMTPPTSTKQVTVQPDGQAVVDFPVTVGTKAESSLDFKAETDGAKDEIIQKIPVYEFGVMQADATSGLTETAVTENVMTPTKADASTGSLTITTSPSIATYLPAGLEYLAEYPYGCAEQTASSFLPNVALSSLQGFEAFHIVDQKALDTNVNGGVQKLYTFQRSDGGFGYWYPSERSHPYLTAYILYTLQVTKNAGYAVDNGVLDRAAAYLKSALRTAETTDPSTRAYILYVLAENGTTDAGSLNAAYEGRKELAVFSKAQLAMALKKSGGRQMEQKAKTLLDEVMTAIRIDSRGAHFEEANSRSYGYLMNTNSRTTAFALQAMIRIDPENPLMPRVVRYLLAIREQGHWDTTQSTSQAILTFVEYLKATNELDADFRTAVAVDGKTVIDTQFNADNVLTRKEVSLALNDMKRGEMLPVQIGKEGKGKLYYDVLLSYFYTPEEIVPLENGIGVLREMEPLNPKVKGVKLGETYKITLTMTVPEDRHFVAVDSPLPAGFEAIDMQLQTSQQGLADTINQPAGNGWWDYYNNGMWLFNHKEFRDDSVFLFADELPAGVYRYQYLVRATLPGKFRYRPAKAWEMYFPETFGQTDGGWFTISE